MVVTEKYCIVQLPMIPFIDYTMIVGVVKTVGVVKCPDIHFQKLGNYDIYWWFDGLSRFDLRFNSCLIFNMKVLLARVIQTRS